jgi:hypothetical protein
MATDKEEVDNWIQRIESESFLAIGHHGTLHVNRS